MAVAETIKPSSSQKHLAAGWRWEEGGGGGGGREGGLDGQAGSCGSTSASTRLSERVCNCSERRFKMSHHLGVDGSYKHKLFLCVSR